MSTYAVDPNPGEGKLKTVKRWLAGNPSGDYVDPNPGEDLLATYKRILAGGGDTFPSDILAFIYRGYSDDDPQPPGLHAQPDPTDVVEDDPFDYARFEWGDGNSDDSHYIDGSFEEIQYLYAEAGMYSVTMTLYTVSGRHAHLTGNVTVPHSPYDEYVRVPA